MTNCLQRSTRNPGAGTMAHRFTTRFLAAVFVTMSLGAAVAVAQNPIPFLNSPVSPAAKSPGAAKFTMTVNGTGFVSGATINWNGVAQTTTFVSSSQLTASISAADIATAGTDTVTVTNPVPGGTSNPAHFEVIKAGFTTAFGKTDYATDLTPQDIATADFNGDGMADLAVATGNNSVSILLGAGNGTFGTNVQYPVPGSPSAIIVGDFNGDGKMDIATADTYISQISVLLGNGDGSFQQQQTYATGAKPVALATADVNGDGKLDIIVADYNSNQVSVLLGNGDGTFQAAQNFSTGNGPSGIAIGDFNADGKLDLAVANNTDGTVGILLGNGDGTFQAQVPYTTATGPTCVVAGAFGSTSTLDLAVGTSDRTISVLLGNGNGTFQNATSYTVGADTVAIATADVNSDGKLDLITANYTDNTVSTLIGSGTGTFKSETVFPTSAGPSGLAIGDFNNDGKLDIAVPAYSTNTVSVLLDSEMTLSPSLLAFGVQTSGIASATKSVVLKNNGTTAYTMGTLSTVGAYPTDFTQTNNCPAAGATLAAGASCTFSNIFDPTASEAANAQLLITSSNGSVLGYQMTGNGNIPITLTPRTMNFSTYQLIGTSSTAKTDTFTNSSGVPITFSKIDLEGADPTEFNMTNNCPVSPATLGPGASCTSTITFSPNQSGGATVTQVYYGNFTLAKQGLLISGLGTAVKVTPTKLAFPSTAVGATSNPMTVTFENAGSTPMPISSAGFSGTEPYWSISANTCGSSVPANSSCTYSIVFTPLTTGSFTATFSIGDPDPTGPQNVSLTGTGKAAADVAK